MLVLQRGYAMNILIIGIDHELQKVKRARESRERAVRKDQLEALLKREVAERNVEFICQARRKHKDVLRETLVLLPPNFILGDAVFNANQFVVIPPLGVPRAVFQVLLEL